METSWPRIDRALFALFASVAVLFAASAFYAYMHRQTHGIWSAPLDDVFIHFDYARATARGYPFQWSEGNGYSSGNTSLTYPFALAVGYWFGFRALFLMEWAAIVACVSVLGFLLSTARGFESLGTWAKYLLPPAVLSLGALNWSLWSGMENAFHLGVWALALRAYFALEEAVAAEADARLIGRRAWTVGAAGALLLWTRPESVVCVATFGLFAAASLRKTAGGRAAFFALARVALPGLLALAVQFLANHAFTGEWSANGAIAKLTINNPYMTRSEKWDEYLFLLKYVILRNTQHHFSDVLPYGWIVPAVALIPLFAKETRRFSLLLWLQALGWLALVAMNAQVRWQNERYTMSAVAWIFVLFALGLAVLLNGLVRFDFSRPRAALVGPIARVGAALAIATVYWIHQLPNMSDQIWFFGRASRNIHDQHLIAGQILRQMQPKRVLVGDAGALLYASDRPGLDLIGLGGYHDYPFARAGAHGLGASLELIERMPDAERPDMMAIYPSWWGDLPTLFGHRLTEVPVFGNVICGGAEKVLYRADWSALDRDGNPRSMERGWMVFDEVDVGDLFSEKDHDYVYPHPSMGFITFRVLADPSRPKRDLFDAGREIPKGQTERMTVDFPRGVKAKLVVRGAPAHASKIDVRIDGAPKGSLELRAPKSDERAGWTEASIDLDVAGRVSLELTPQADEGFADYHVWVLAQRVGQPAADP